MASESFLHGAEVLDIDSGSRTIQTISTSIIGIVGTAPDADPDAFPLNTPVLIAGSELEAARLDMTGEGAGTLPMAMDSIFDQTKPVVIVVRVEEGDDTAETLANVLGGVNAQTGQYLGVHALLAAESRTGYKPKILCVPGFTHTRREGALTSVSVTNAGSGYTSAPKVTFSGGGSGSSLVLPTAHAELGEAGDSGKVLSVAIDDPGQNMTTAPVITFEGGEGTGAVATANIGIIGNAVASEMTGIAEKLGAVVIVDGPNTVDADAIDYGKDFGNKRLYVVDPKVLKTDNDGKTVTAWSSPCVCGLIAKMDNERGFWWSPSNQVINGITGTARTIDFQMGDYSCRANLLNENNIATVIRQDGYRLWGNRTLSSDQKWAFLSVVRTADTINESLLKAHLWAVDRGITKNYVEEVIEGVNAYLRHLKSVGAILGGQCWADRDLNTADQISAGHIYFDFDFTPVYPAEHITFRSHLVNDYVVSIFDNE